jgi:hypothetical protein
VSERREFDAELYEGHDGTWAVKVPFDPSSALGTAFEPVTHRHAKEGHVVRGTMNGARFDGFIGKKYGFFFLLVEGALRASVGAAPGDTVTVVVEPRGGRTLIAGAPVVTRRKKKRKTKAKSKSKSTRSSKPKKKR